MDDDVQFMLTTDNESALSIVVKNCDTENRVLNELVYHLTKSLARDKEKDELDFREQCMVSSHLRPIQYWLTELNNSNIACLPQLYELLSLPVKAENIHIEKPVREIETTSYPDSRKFDLGEKNKTFEKYAI